DIYSLLGKLAHGRVYAYAVPCCDYHAPHQKRPFILFSLSQENNYNASQQLTGQRITISADCYAQTVADARALREQVRAALAVLQPNKTVEYNDFDVEYEKFRMTLEVDVVR
ncbi:tail completion protein gp17, partial [Dickeya chrysanthemi]|uniref:tail completion protein gp17 n=1 Tax=Dickeya chrysanthemi TaxID=556 RepID=UPI00301829FD